MGSGRIFMKTSAPHPLKKTYQPDPYWLKSFSAISISLDNAFKSGVREIGIPPPPHTYSPFSVSALFIVLQTVNVHLGVLILRTSEKEIERKEDDSLSSRIEMKNREQDDS
jgi:hypothetical protein